MLDSISNFFTGKKNDVQDGSSEQVNPQQFSSTESTSSQKPDTALPKNLTTESPKEVNVNADSSVNIPKHFADCETLTGKQLKLTYPHEYNSWRGRKSWAKKHKVPFSPDFESFADFLSHHGPKPDSSQTLDRIDNSKGYAPGNTRWASKTTQAENRKNVSHHKIVGDEIPQPAIAHALGLSPDALRKRLARGDGVLDIIAERTGSNKHGKPNPKKPIWEWPWPEQSEDKWETVFQRCKWSNETRLSFFIRYCNEKIHYLQETYAGNDGLSPKEIDLCNFWKRMREIALETVALAEAEYHAQGAIEQSPDFLLMKQAFS